MSWVFKLVGGAATAALGALLAMMFQGQIVRYFNPDRLSADVYVGYWLPIPSTESDQAKNFESQGLGPYAINQIASGKMLTFVRVEIRNSGAKEVKDIRFDLDGLTPDVGAVSRDGAALARLPQTPSIQIAPLSPGESARVLMWVSMDDDYPWQYAIGKWRTYSSEGPIIIHLHDSTDNSFNNATDDFLGEILGWVLAIAALIMIVGLFIGASFYYKYQDQLLEDEDWYLSERTRRDADPKKFSPKLKDSK